MERRQRTRPALGLASGSRRGGQLGKRSGGRTTPRGADGLGGPGARPRAGWVGAGGSGAGPRPGVVGGPARRSGRSGFREGPAVGGVRASRRWWGVNDQARTVPAGGDGGRAAGSLRDGGGVGAGSEGPEGRPLRAGAPGPTPGGRKAARGSCGGCRRPRWRRGALGAGGRGPERGAQDLAAPARGSEQEGDPAGCRDAGGPIKVMRGVQSGAGAFRSRPGGRWRSRSPGVRPGPRGGEPRGREGAGAGGNRERARERLAGGGAGGPRYAGADPRVRVGGTGASEGDRKTRGRGGV